MIQRYKQTTYETCLACCLFGSIKANLNQELELECINYSMKFSRDDFVAGHLDFIAKKYNIKSRRIVDNKYFFNYINRVKVSELVTNEVKKINLGLVDNLLSKSSVVLYLDSYVLYQITHYPHFVVVLKKLEKAYLIYDPWDGKEKIIDKKILSKGIIYLRNHLRFCPQIISLN